MLLLKNALILLVLTWPIWALIFGLMCYKPSRHAVGRLKIWGAGLGLAALHTVLVLLTDTVTLVSSWLVVFISYTFFASFFWAIVVIMLCWGWQKYQVGHAPQKAGTSVNEPDNDAN